MNHRIVLLALAFFLVAPFQLCIADNTKTNDELLAMLSSADISERVGAAKTLSNSVDIDPRLYQTVELKLISGYQNVPQDGVKRNKMVEEMAWYCNVLASSGDPKYLAVLEGVAAETTLTDLQQYAANSASMLAQAQAATATSSQEQAAEGDSIMSMLSSNDILKRTMGAKKLTNSGLADSRLYQAVELKLVSGFKNVPADPVELNKMVDEMAWYCKALASSGDEKYRIILEGVAAETNLPKLQKYASQSAGRIGEYSQRNQVINSTASNNQGLSPEGAKVMNMLTSSMANLQKQGARKVYNGEATDPQLFAVINEQLLVGYQTGHNDRNHNDCMAWYCKALASSGDARYRATLETVAGSRQTSDTVKRWAQKSLQTMQ